jgi:hypothetical protein
MATRPSVRRNSSVKIPSAAATPLPRTQPASYKDHVQRRSAGGGLLATLFRPPARPNTTVLHKEVARQAVLPFTLCPVTNKSAGLIVLCA